MLKTKNDHYGLLDVIEVAEIWGVSDQMVYKLAKEGKIPHVRIGKRIKLRRGDVMKYIKDNLIGAKEEEDE